MDTRKDSPNKDDENNQHNDQEKVLHRSYCPKEPHQIPKDWYHPYKAPSGLLRYDAHRQMYFYTTVNTPNATQELLDKIADNKHDRCKIL